MVWSMVAASCLTMAALNLLVWVRDRRMVANGIFAVLAVAFAVFLLHELMAMRAGSAAEYTRVHRHAHVAMFFVLVGIVGFVRCYFGTGRVWLLWTIIGLRALILILAFIPGPTFNFREISSLGSFSLFGESVAVAQGEPSPWARLGELSGLIVLGFVVDAAVSLWRGGSGRERRRALVVGGAVVLTILIPVTFSFLLHTGKVKAPYLAGVSFLLVVAAIGYELSRDMIRAARLAAELEESTESMQLAAEAARLALWRWDVRADRVWVNPRGRELYGIPETEPVGLQRFLATLHPDDRAATGVAVQSALDGAGEFRAEYRVAGPDGETRWIEARGRVDFDGGGGPLRMRGVSADATERRHAEVEAGRLRGELAHAGRVTLLGQLSSAIAHELGQPLGAILRNAEAAELMLGQDAPDLGELREIVADIKSDDRRASAVIDRLRSLFRRQGIDSAPVDLRGVVDEVLALLGQEVQAKRVALLVDVPTTLPRVVGDRIHLMQVLLNLAVNGIDAIDRAGATVREVRISAGAADDGGSVGLVVSDSGPGVPPADRGRLFEPFFTSKPEGMGMGLPVSRTIAEAHGGTLELADSVGGGAEFRLTLPAVGTG